MLKEDELVKVLLPYCKPQYMPKGSVLWLEGDTKGMAVVLKKGRVKIYRMASNATAVTLFIMKQHDIFGFLPLIYNRPYPVSAEALDDIEAMVLDRTTFDTIIKKDPQVCVSLLQYIAHYLRLTFDGIARLSSRSAITRVASAIVGLLEEYGYSKHNKPVISLPTTAKEYAQLIGLTPESFSRKLTELSKLGIIEKSGTNRLRIKDIEKLRELANQELFF